METEQKRILNKNLNENPFRNAAFDFVDLFALL